MDSKGSRHRLDHGHDLKGALGWVLDTGRASSLSVALWRLATQDAEWSPADPGQLVGRSIDDVAIDGDSGELGCMLSDGSVLDVRPGAIEREDDLPNWELVSPFGVVLEFGPGMRWQISGADRPVSSRR
jgi:hypothetical protein